MWLYYGRLEIRGLAVIGKTRQEVKDLLWSEYKRCCPRQSWPEYFRGFQDVADYYGGGIQKVKLGEVFAEGDD